MNSSMFKEKLVEDNLLRYSKLTLLVTTLCLLANFYNRTRHYFVTQAEGLSLEASKRDFCTMALNQMINKKLSKKIVTDGLFELVTAENYKNMFFSMEDKVSSVFTGENSCKALVKTKDGLRSFDLYLEQSDESEFYYQINKIHENELYEKES